MRKTASQLKSKVIRNKKSTPKKVIVDQMNERRELPLGKAAFFEWADRIIAGALIPHAEGCEEKLRESQIFALANMILHLGPNESSKPDGHFIHGLRTSANKQVAFDILSEIKEKQEQRKKAALEIEGCEI